MDSPPGGLGSRPASHSAVRSFHVSLRPSAPIPELERPEPRLDLGRREAERPGDPLGRLARPRGGGGEDGRDAPTGEGAARRLGLEPPQCGEVVELGGRQVRHGVEVGERLAVPHEVDPKGPRGQRGQAAEGIVGARGRGGERHHPEQQNEGEAARGRAGALHLPILGPGGPA